MSKGGVKDLLKPGPNYRLSAISPHPNAALDGTDVGANIEALLAATAAEKQRRASSSLGALLIPARITSVTSPIRTHHTCRVRSAADTSATNSGTTFSA